MSHLDAEKWNQRYLTTKHSLSQPREFLLAHLDKLPKQGWGLDAAMGLGHNANLLSERGLKMVGLDISRVALSRVRERYPKIHCLHCDLPNIRFAPSSFDVLLNFWFFHGELLPVYQRLIKTGGFFMFESRVSDGTGDDLDWNPDYLVKPGELLTAFAGWDVLCYDEGVQTLVRGKTKQAVRFLAQKQ